MIHAPSVDWYAIAPEVALIVGAFALQSGNLRWTTTVTVAQVARTSIILVFAFSGVESALVPSGEVRDPARTVPRAIILTTLTGGGIFVALAYAGFNFAADSWGILEHSSTSSEGPPVYWFKTAIPAAGVMILLQGLVEIVRCVICLKTGEWPSREEDVEEVDVDKLKEMVHVKDEDIAALDKYLTAHDAKAGAQS